MKKAVFFIVLCTMLLAASAYAESKTVVLQQGLNEYTGCEDQELRDPETNYGRGPKEEVLLISEW
ncbi:MAG: hypothetical protein JW863_22470 [Chitinispirillaceae bacterium]|nr:hypothetical protein [Chitinispirillaceae bacterium]